MKHLLLTVVWLLMSVCAHGQTHEIDGLELSVRLEAESSLERGLGFLVSQQQSNGEWTGQPGISGMAILSLALSEPAPDSPRGEAVMRGISWLSSQVRRDGTVGKAQKELDVYAQSAALLAFSQTAQCRLFPDPDANAATMAAIQKRLLASRLTTGYAYGAFRYQTETYPDLSNTHWATEALYVASRHLDLPKMKRFLRETQAVTRSCQLPEDSVTDAGGFTYFPLSTDETEKVPERHQQELARARVWGSLTWGGIKSLIYAGVADDDLAVTQGLTWTSRHLSFKENPGLGKGGYYYYLYMLASGSRALNTTQLTIQTDGKESREVDWRYNLVNALLSDQRGHGQWENSSALWLENNPVLCTAYATLALQFALQ